MKLSLRIPLTMSIIVVVTGIIAFVKISIKNGALPVTSFTIWLAVSLILIGITLWSWFKKKI